MSIIIFEGIATSGKTTLTKLLEKEFRCIVTIAEGETLMGLIDNKDKRIAHSHLSHLLDGLEKRKDTTFIIDRFHLTHAFRTGTALSSFADIEGRLQDHSALLVFLRIDPTKIKERIEETAAIRAGAWSKGKRGTVEERVEYYTNQQNKLAELFAESTLKKVVIDTTNKNWKEYVEEILSAC